MQGDLPQEVAVPAGEEPAAAAARLPAAWCVALLSDADAVPLQLLCVKNLRAAIRRRLEEPDDASPTRRIDYRAILRRVRFARVESDFEQDVLYLEAARRYFPESYGGVLGFQPAWFIHVNPATRFPRFIKANEIARRAGRYFGPAADKHAAHKLVHAIEELFDLCRDYSILTASPAGPCQWRQMGRCVGPCDGSISLEGYRSLIAHAAETLADVNRAVEGHTVRMRQAAAGMHFEEAARIKRFAESMARMSGGVNRHVRPLESFRFLAVMPGGRRRAPLGKAADAVKLFSITPGRIAPLMTVTGPLAREEREQALRLALSALEDGQPKRPMPSEQFERISLVTHHLFAPRKRSGRFLHADELSERAFANALREVSRPRSAPAAEDDREIRGLQAL